MKCTLPLLDGVGNIVLGVLLVFFPASIVQFLGIPVVEPPFYASLLGAVLVGIGVALLLEVRHPGSRASGLGLGGAIVINMCFGIVLLCWLVFGRLQLPARGLVVLWTLACILVVLSGIEALSHVLGGYRKRVA